MKRRDLLLAAGAALAWPPAARARKASPVIGYLNSQSPGPYAHYIAAFRQGLAAEGYSEGQNLAIEYRWAEGRDARLAPMAAELVHRHVAVIATGGGPAAALAAKAVTETIPIVFNVGVDPVKLGLVASFSHPGGNVTGFDLITAGLDGKRLGLLREIVPNAKLILVLLNPKNPNAEIQLHEIEQAARSVGQQIKVVHAATEDQLDAVLTKSRTAGASALLVGADPFFNSLRHNLVSLVAGLTLPAIYELREFAEAGGLMSYGPSIAEGYRQVGIYTGKILNGSRPADLPVVQSTKFELVINMKAANALRLTVPRLLRAQADDIIE